MLDDVLQAAERAPVEPRQPLGGPGLVDVAHWAAEWTWLPVVEAKLRAAVAVAGDTVDTRVSEVVTDPWTFRTDHPRFRP